MNAPTAPALTRPPQAEGHLDHGYLVRTVRTPSLSFRLPVRWFVTSLVLLVAAAALVIVTIRFGDYPLTLRQVLDTLTGAGTRFHRTIVLEWRLPISIAAVVFGALLGLGGAVFQSLTRNPLGSPDIIGFDAGSYTAVVVAMLFLHVTDYWTIAGASILGGLLTAVVVYALSYRRGVAGFRLIIVGIGVTAMLGSLNSYLITRAALKDAMAVGFWGAGSLARVSWPTLLPCLAIAAALFVAAAFVAPGLARLELGDDAAVTLGTRPGPVRLASIVIGVATSALVTAAAGPIGFIALVAPQLARRVTRSPGVSLLSAAAMGAALLATAHLLSLLTGIWFQPVPVGLVTVCVGGSYLVWLLIQEARRHYGGPS